MAEMNGEWGELLSDLAVLEAESDEDSELAEDEESDEDAEFDPITLGVGALAARKLGLGRRHPVRRAMQVANYAQAVRGKNAGIVQTPSGPARIALPGNFPTVEEFRKTVTAIQKDMKANSAGIKELTDQQKKDTVRLADLITKLDKKMTKRNKRAQIISWIGLAASLGYPILRQRFPNL